MTDTDSAKHAPDTRMVDRMLYFSDAVFAIVLTLLVLELRPPEFEDDEALRTSLMALGPKFFAFAMSFAVVGIFWAAHMTTTRRLAVFDWPAAWLNLIFLFAIALMPFITAMMGEHGASGLAWQIYCGALIAASLTQTLLVAAVTRGRGRLVGGMSLRERTFRFGRALSPGIAFAAGLYLSLQGEALLSAFCWVLIPVVIAFMRLLTGSFDGPGEH